MPIFEALAELPDMASASLTAPREWATCHSGAERPSSAGPRGAALCALHILPINGGGLGPFEMAFCSSIWVSPKSDGDKISISSQLVMTLFHSSSVAELDIPDDAISSHQGCWSLAARHGGACHAS